MTNRARQIFKPEFRFGLGGVSLGNEFNKHTDKDAEAIVRRSLDIAADICVYTNRNLTIEALATG